MMVTQYKLIALMNITATLTISMVAEFVCEILVLSSSPISLWHGEYMHLLVH